MRILLAKTGLNQFAPADEAAEKVMSRVGRGQCVYAEVKRARNPGFHRKFMKMLRLAYDNQAFYSSFESFRREVVMRCGYAQAHVHIDGTRSMTPESISFDSMDQDTFETLYEEAISVICEDFVATGNEVLDGEVVAQIAELTA